MTAKKNGLITALFLAGLLITAAPSQAELNWYAWNDGNGNWSVPGNWLSGTIPNALDAGAHITGLNVTVYLEMPVTLGAMEVDAGNRVVLQDSPSYPGYPINLHLAPGAIVNNYGTIRLTDTPLGNYIWNEATATFTGSGELVMESWMKNQLGFNFVGPITNDTLHTIRGAGRILTGITNKGKIIADNGLLSLHDVVNNQGGTISAQGVGNVLALRGAFCTGGQFNPEDGLIELSQNATLRNCGIGQGKIENSGAGGCLGGNTFLDPGTEITVDSGSSMLLAYNAMVTNNGIIRLDSTFGQAKLQIFEGQTSTLKGAGRLDMIGGPDSLITGSGNLVNDTGHTIRGGDSIAVATNNKGQIHVDDYMREMRIEQPVTGTGLVKVANGGTLSLYNSLQCGLMEVWDTATLVLNTNNLQGGDLFLWEYPALQVNDNRTLDLKGNLYLNMKDASKWNWNAGSVLQMSGGGASKQSLEVGGQDYGASSQGFNQNFNLVGLALSSPGTYVFLINESLNITESPEALYVDNLTVPEDTTLNLNRLNLYTHYPNSTAVYRVVAGDGAKFGGGRIIDISEGAGASIPSIITPLLLD